MDLNEAKSILEKLKNSSDRVSLPDDYLAENNSTTRSEVGLGGDYLYGIFMIPEFLVFDLVDVYKADRDKWKTKYKELDAGVVAQIGRTLDIADGLDTAIQECDRWETRAEALERAITGKCDYCKHSRKSFPCDDEFCNWQFDEARFKKKVNKRLR